MRTGRLHSAAVLSLAGLVVLTMPVVARADEGGGDADVRVEHSCTGSSTVRLRVRTRDDALLRVDVDVRTTRHGVRWSVVTVHERRLVWRAQRRASKSSTLSLRFAIEDWPGRDTVTVRATGPRGETCRASATVDGD